MDMDRLLDSGLMGFDIVPGFDMILVKPDKQVGVTESGLFIPDNAIRRNVTGYVVALGKPPEVYEDTFNVGDYVLWFQHAGVGLERNDEIVWAFVHYKDIIASIPTLAVGKADLANLVMER